MIAAVDSRGGHVAIHGWRTVLPVTAVDAVRELEPYCGEFLYTHVDAEGLLRGTDMDAILAVRHSTGRRLTAAGGITTRAEIDRLMPKASTPSSGWRSTRASCHSTISPRRGLRPAGCLALQRLLRPRRSLGVAAGTLRPVRVDLFDYELPAERIAGLAPSRFEPSSRARTRDGGGRAPAFRGVPETPARGRPSRPKRRARAACAALRPRRRQAPGRDLPPVEVGGRRSAVARPRQARAASEERRAHRLRGGSGRRDRRRPRQRQGARRALRPSARRFSPRPHRPHAPAALHPAGGGRPDRPEDRDGGIRPFSPGSRWRSRPRRPACTSPTRSSRRSESAASRPRI